MRIPGDAIPAAAFRFESQRGLPLGPVEIAAIRKHGFQDLDPELLARELRHLITAERKGDHRDRQQAYWALGKKRDRSLLPFFRAQLRLELQRDMAAAYQIMIALDDLEEPIFAPGRGSRARDDYELNRQDSECYLAPRA